MFYQAVVDFTICFDKSECSTRKFDSEVNNVRILPDQFNSSADFKA